MTTKRRAAAKTATSTELTEGPPEGRTEAVVVKDELVQSEPQGTMDAGTAMLTAKVAELEAALATLLPKVQEPKAPFDMAVNSMQRPDEWVNEFTTEEVLKYIESAAHEENEINSATLYAYRQRQAFEHKKERSDPTNCPGWFITISGNIRRDY